MTVFHLLCTADMLVPDADARAALLVRGIGLPEPKAAWIHDFPGHGYRAIFARVNPDRAAAPTLLEIIAPVPPSGPADPAVPRVPADEISAWQGNRPVKTHATVVATPDLPGLIELLRSRGVPHRIDPRSEPLPFDRVWIGSTPEAPHLHRAEVDAGLVLEAIPVEAMALPDGAGAPSPAEPEAGSGAMIRIVSRAFLVDDLDGALRALDAAVGWQPAGAVELVRGEGYRRATMALTLPCSARLELIQPTDPGGEAGRFAGRWGPGAYRIRIGVHGLDAAAERLRALATPFRTVQDDGVEVVRPRPEALDGALIEFVEAAG